MLSEIVSNFEAERETFAEIGCTARIVQIKIVTRWRKALADVQSVQLVPPSPDPSPQQNTRLMPASDNTPIHKPALSTTGLAHIENPLASHHRASLSAEAAAVSSDDDSRPRDDDSPSPPPKSGSDSFWQTISNMSDMVLGAGSNLQLIFFGSLQCFTMVGLAARWFRCWGNGGGDTDRGASFARLCTDWNATGTIRTDSEEPFYWGDSSVLFLVAWALPHAYATVYSLMKIWRLAYPIVPGLSTRKKHWVMAAAYGLSTVFMCLWTGVLPPRNWLSHENAGWGLAGVLLWSSGIWVFFGTFYVPFLHRKAWIKVPSIDCTPIGRLS